MSSHTPTPLSSLLARSDVWRASAGPARPTGTPTGFGELDRALHDGGWPQRGLSELLVNRFGAGELGLLLPIMAKMNHQDGWILLIAPPYLPFAPTWLDYGIDIDRVIIVRPGSSAEQLWATEQALQSGDCSAVLSWLTPSAIPFRQLRKLQLASRHNIGLSVLIRSQQCAAQPSPARLRIQLQLEASHLQLKVIKQSGGWAGQHLRLPHRAQSLMPQLATHQLPFHVRDSNNAVAQTPTCAVIAPLRRRRPSPDS